MNAIGDKYFTAVIQMLISYPEHDKHCKMMILFKSSGITMILGIRQVSEHHNITCKKAKNKQT